MSNATNEAVKPEGSEMDRTNELSAKAAYLGFDFGSVDACLIKALEELGELASAPTRKNAIEEVGDVIFVMVNFLRFINEDNPERVLALTNDKFEDRMRAVQKLADRDGVDLASATPDAVTAYWKEAKNLTKSRDGFRRRLDGIGNG